ncbi:MAG: transposase [Thermoanaerobaculia bacterium]|nr:transposase [Thermoanaerobaculia bacterium]
MTDRDLVEGISREVVAENLQIYRRLFQETSLAETKDAYWKSALSLYAELSDNQRGQLFKIIHQTIIDTISNMFGLIDGVSSLTGQTEALSLLHGEVHLEGDLQDLFLERIELEQQ